MKTDKSKIILIAVELIIVAALSIGFYFYVKNDHLKQSEILNIQKNEFIQIVNSRDSTINEWLATSYQIEKDIALIKQKENYFNVNKQKLNNSELSTDQRLKLIDDINYVKSLIDNNKKKIKILNDKLKLNGEIIVGLQDKINMLDSILNHNDFELIKMKNIINVKDIKITKLNTKVDSISTIVVEKNQIIVDQIKEKNKAYLLIDTFKNLQSKNITTKTGGFIGIAERKSLTSTFKDSLFTCVDLTKYNIIPIGAKSAKLLTNHPADSYKMIYDTKNYISLIEILNPTEFWKISKYCVVEVK